MIGTQSLKEEKPGLIALAYPYVLRSLAAICILGGLAYWIKLTGLDGSTIARFDLIEPNARIALTSLAVILPFAGLGLWMGSSWGLVLWVACAVTQVLMHTLWASQYGERPFLVAFQFMAAAVLFVFLVSYVIEWRKMRLSGY